MYLIRASIYSRRIDQRIYRAKVPGPRQIRAPDKDAHRFTRAAIALRSCSRTSHLLRERGPSRGFTSASETVAGPVFKMMNLQGLRWHHPQ
jgi:hypothetical protein